MCSLGAASTQLEPEFTSGQEDPVTTPTKQEIDLLNDVPELQVTSTFQFTDDAYAARFLRAEVDAAHRAHLNLLPHTTVSSALDDLLAALPETDCIPVGFCIIFEPH
jgi:hypothetical protein